MFGIRSSGITLAITNGPDFLLIGRACRVCRIWFDRDQSEDSRVVPIVPDTAYMTGMTNRQTGSKDNNTDSPLVIASPVAHIQPRIARPSPVIMELTNSG